MKNLIRCTPLLAICALVLGSSSCSTIQELPRRTFLGKPVRSSTTVEQISMVIGQRSFEDERWEPVEDLLLIGLNYMPHPNSTWLGFDLGISYSEAHSRRVLTVPGEVNLKARAWEAHVGVRKEVRLWDSPIRVYGSAGGAVLFVDAKLTDQNETNLFDDRDNGISPYVRFGVLWDIDEIGGAIGIDIKHVRGGTIDIAGIEPEIDNTQVGLTFSYTL